MSDVLVRPDAELAVRSWLRDLGQFGEIPDVKRNAHFGFPRSKELPCLVVNLIVDVDDDYIDVLGESEIQIDAIASSKEQACTVARYVAAQIKALACGTPMGTEAICKAARVVLGPLPRAEDERLTTPDGKPAPKGSTPSRSVVRYIVGARFSLIPSA